MKRPAARQPRRHPRPYSVTVLPYRGTQDERDDAALEAVCAQTIAALQRLGLVRDGRRSLTMAEWDAEILRVAQPIEDAERTDRHLERVGGDAA